VVKLSASKVDGFMRALDPAVRAILLYGPDDGLVRERADVLTGQVVDDLADPFRVTELTPAHLKEDPARLADEAAALSMTGGRRVVRLRPAGDNESEALKTFLADAPGEALVVVEAGELPPRSKLRKAFEGAKNGAALPCYFDEEGGLRRVIEETLAPGGFTMEPAAERYLAGVLGGNRLMTRGELEKLALFMGDERRITLDHAAACIGDSSVLTLDAVVIAAGAGDSAGVERGLTRAYLEGTSPVAVLRAAARHLQRLHLAAGARARGESVQGALRGFRPPLHFKMEKAMQAQIDRWPLGRVAGAMTLVLDAERDCKTTGMPAEVVCSRALMRVAQAARSARQR
jgi:DNA polymerase-3 subunit delta